MYIVSAKSWTSARRLYCGMKKKVGPRSYWQHTLKDLTDPDRYSSLYTTMKHKQVKIELPVEFTKGF